MKLKKPEYFAVYKCVVLTMGVPLHRYTSRSTMNHMRFRRALVCANTR